MVGIAARRTWVSGHLYHPQPTTGYVAFLKFALHSTVSGICELYPVTHRAPHILSRTLVRELLPALLGIPHHRYHCPAVRKELLTPAFLSAVQLELHAKGSSILYFTFNHRYAETCDSLRYPDCAHNQA